MNDHAFQGELLNARIGYLVIQTEQVFTEDPSLTVEIRPSQGQGSADYVFDIWPPSLKTITWPPPVVLDDRSFERFCHRLAQESTPPPSP